jgi:hypothetical protein
MILFLLLVYKLEETGTDRAPITPPSTVSIVPVQYDPARLDKYMHAPAMSSSRPMRPSGTTLLLKCCASAPHVAKLALMRLGT